MKIILGFLILYLIMPYFGLWTFTNHQLNLYGNIDNCLIRSYSIHLVIIFSIIFLIIFLTNTKKKYLHNEDIKPNKINSVLNKSIIFLIISLFFQLFVFGGLDILLGNTGRGEFRTTLGFLGFLYNFFTMFLPAGIIIISSIFFKVSDKRIFFRVKIYIIFFLGLLIGILTGFKFTAILILSGGLVQLSDSLKIKYLFIIAIFFLFLMSFSAYYFMDLDPETALNYIFARATSVALEGTVGVWNLFPNGGTDSWMALLYAFGNKLSSLITGYSTTDIEFLKINITRLIGYLTYPKHEEALSGAFNLTVTNFGEGVYYFGKYYYFIFSIITGTILGFTIRYYFKTIQNNKILKNTMINVYMMTVLFPWLMGGVIGNLFGIPTIIYMLLLYIILKIIISNIIFKKRNFNENTIYNR